MDDPLLWFAPLVQTPVDAIRWACILEATAPKAGNVYPGRSFTDLSYLDFVEAAEIAAACFGRAQRFSEGIRDAVLETACKRKSNVNLGILLLLGPLVAADQRMDAEQREVRSPDAWKESIALELAGLDRTDGRNVFRAIGAAAAGGLGKVESLDVDDQHDSIDLLAAMKLAADRDRIARQYDTGFADVIDHVAPTLRDAILRCGDVLQGIGRAHLQLLAWAPDSLISRKNGEQAALQVQSLAKGVAVEDRVSVDEFDVSLRSPDHRLNPGTTADLIAAGLYVLLRSLQNNSSFGNPS